MATSKQVTAFDIGNFGTQIPKLVTKHATSEKSVTVKIAANPALTVSFLAPSKSFASRAVTLNVKLPGAYGGVSFKDTEKFDALLSLLKSNEAEIRARLAVIESNQPVGASGADGELLD